MATAIESADTESPISSEQRAQRPQRCPKCGKQRLARRPRESDERHFTRTLGKIIKIRPYRCSACKYETWKLKGWTAGPLLTAGLALVALLVIGAIGLMIWLSVPPERSPTLAPMGVQAAVSNTPPDDAAPAPNVDNPPAPATATVEPSAEAPSALEAPSTPPAATPSNELRSATLQTVGGRSTLLLKTRTRVETYRTWMLQDGRNRFVIDIPGRWAIADTVERMLTVTLPKIDRIGLAEHADHLRIAIRLRGGYLAYEPTIETTDDGLLIRLN